MKQVGSAVLVYRVFNKVAKALEWMGKEKTCAWRELLAPKAEVTRGVQGHALRKKFGNLGFQHSGAKIRVFEQNRDIITFWLS